MMLSHAMDQAPQLLLIGAVGAVGVLHTLVPDHWVPITMLARQRGWSAGETARAALQAGTGHVLSTLAIGLALWIVGAAAAQRFGTAVDEAASAALVLFGGWIAVSAWREREPGDAHGHQLHHHHDALGPHPHHHHEDEAPDAADAPARDWLYAPLGGGAAALTRHRHVHRHGPGARHSHWHDHDAASAHEVAPETVAEPPLHHHPHRTATRTALLLILGSSPMIEGIPAFFAAARYGAALVAVMAGVFAAATIATYVVLSLVSSQGLQRVSLGPLERYGEVLSGAVIAAVGALFWVWA